MAIERVCVIGAGVIGSLYAGHLASVAAVSVLTRRDDQAQALGGGLRITGKSELTARVEATADAAQLPDFDLGIVATKATQLGDAAHALAGRAPGATMMTIQNGLGAEELLRAEGDWPLLSAVTFMSGVRHSDTHVEYELDTETWLGPFAGTTTYEQAQEVEALLVSSGLHARAFPDLRSAQWFAEPAVREFVGCLHHFSCQTLFLPQQRIKQGSFSRFAGLTCCFIARHNLGERCQYFCSFGFWRDFKYHLPVALGRSKCLRIMGNNKGRYNAHSLGKISSWNFRTLRHTNLVQNQARRLVIRAGSLEKINQILGISQASELRR